MNKRYVIVAFVMLVLAALACNRTVPTATPEVGTPLSTTATGDATPSGTPDGSPVDLTPTPDDVTPGAATATPTETAPTCIYDADFVSDVTIPDDTELAPGTAFVKTWRMRNSGTCAWEPGTRWAFDSGDQMQGPDEITVPATEPGTTADISVNLIAPATPKTYTGFWRMRRPNGDVFGTRSFVRIVVISDQVTATPTTTPTATPTSQPGVGPVINFLRSDRSQADPGDTITLEWETRRAASAILYHLMPTGQLGSFWEVGVNGLFEYEIDPSERNHTDFLLIVSDNEGRTAQASLSVALRCPDAWFFASAPNECPGSAALVSNGAEEHFEHGVMIWVEDQDAIYVQFDDGQSPTWSIYTDEWDPGEPTDDPSLTPPTGLYQPVRGFGVVWRENPGVRARLGWAIDPETGFTVSVQRTSRPKYNDIFIRALDGKVWRLLPEASGWEKIS